MRKATLLPKEQFKQAVEHHLTGKETEPWEIIHFKVYRSQLPVNERALETAALMLGSDKSRGYCLEMNCADFLAGAAMERPDASTLVLSLQRLIHLLPDEQKQQVLERDGWRSQFCGSLNRVEVHHLEPRSRLGDDREDNLSTLCAVCHQKVDRHKLGQLTLAGLRGDSKMRRQKT